MSPTAQPARGGCTQSSPRQKSAVDLGTPGNNTGDAAGDTYTSIEGIIGSAFNDDLTGDGGDNHLRGGAGADALDGGAGFDFANYFESTIGLTANLGNAALNTGEAKGDTYTSIEGLVGSAFDDTLVGDANDNFLRGGPGADTLQGGNGFDFADYNTAAAAVTANLANAAANTGEAAGDTYTSIEGIRGSKFADVLVGDANTNFLRGGLGADKLDGGDGFDFADYFNSTVGLTVNLGNAVANTGEAAGDIYTSIEGIRGSKFADTLTGNGGNNFLRGGEGADALNGAGGFDYADYSGAGPGLIVSLAAPASNNGEAKGDTYTSIEGLAGSANPDVLTGNSADNNLIGRAGADALDGGGGFDFADYRTSSAGLTVDLGTPGNNTGDAAGDTYTSIEGIIGSAFNDDLTGDGGDNHLRGGAGADALDGGAGFDFANYFESTIGLTANLGNAALNTGEAKGDTYTSIEGLAGSAFDDTLVGDANDNFLRGGPGADTLQGGSGFDFADYNTAAAAVTANLANAAANTGEAAGDTYSSIEGIRGSKFADTLVGDDATGNFLRGGLGADKLDGRGGFDYADYFNASTGVTVNLANPAANTGEAAGDTFVSIEGIRGSKHNDTLIGDAGDNFLRGGEGADVLNGGSGGFDFADYRNAAAGVKVDLGDPSKNNGEALGDTYISIEGIQGSTHDDELFGNAGLNFLRGGLGADKLDGGGGTDFADYQTAGSAVVASLALPGSNTGEAAGDTYTSIEGLRGSAFADTLTGDGGANELRGGGGGDTLTGGGGADLFAYVATSEGGDIITDFVTGTDKMAFRSSAFGGLPVGALSASEFNLGTSAAAGAHFFYDTAADQLFYDADSTGAGAAVLIATFTNNPTLSATDIVITAG